MARLFFFLSLTFLFSIANAQTIPTPRGDRFLEEVSGDLDKDGKPEKVIVYNTSDSAEYGTTREIVVFKLTGTKWTVLKKSRNAVLASQEGGMMGDPFGSIEIKNGILLVHQAGGSSWKWGYTDKYRFQNNTFQLIGFTTTYGKNCEYWGSFDFNLSTGQINYKKETCNEDGEDPKVVKTEKETFFKKGIFLNLENRKTNEIIITSPKYKEKLYL